MYWVWHEKLVDTNVILGIKLTISASSITLSQSHHTEKVLEKYKYLDCRPTTTPYNLDAYIKKSKGESIDLDCYA